MSGERYRFLLRMPHELRRRLVEATDRSGRSINAEIVSRLEASLERESEPDRVPAQTPARQGSKMRQRRMRRRLVAFGVITLLLAVVAVGGLLTGGGGGSAAPATALETEELAPALATKIAANATFAAPASLQEGGRVDDEFLKHSTPGNTVPAAAVQKSLNDWKKVKGRAKGGKSDWKPLGPTTALGLDNQYRDRSVYNAGTPNFSGRIAHVAIEPGCKPNGQCTMWIANANGGVWRTNRALDASPKWTYVSAGFEHNNVASIALDPNDKQSRDLWVGTGEPNACGSGCEAGVGLYFSKNAGNSWTGPYGRESFNNRAVGSIAIKPGDSKTIYAASGRAVRGVSNVCCGGADALIPGAPHFGLYRSTNGGESWQLVNQGAPELCTATPPDVVSAGGTPCSPRGARRVMIDPVDPNTVYASFFARGIWRSNDGGTTWTQIMAPLGGGNNERAEFDLVKLGNATRMYVGVGGGAGQFAKFRRSDSVRTGVPTFTDLTSSTEDTPGFSSYGYCDPQCSYDNYVYAPAGHFPGSGANEDVVYLLGDNSYNENNWGPASPYYAGEPPACDSAAHTKPCGRSNGRGVALSTNAGVSFTDMTDDTTDDVYPVQLHPDHHALVVNPSNYKQFFTVGDGGVVRSNGVLVDDSGDCTQPKGYTLTRLTFCQMLLKSVPEKLEAINEGLRTLHFYEIAVSPHDPDLIVGGTQDNGSWERADGDTWVNTNVADGGHNNFDIADPNFRQSGFQQGQLMVTYEPRNQEDMNWIADTLFEDYGNEGVPFIGPATSDPKNAGWLWTAREHVFRSTNYGRNPAIPTKESHRENCNIWYGDFDVNEDGVYTVGVDRCDDWKPLGDPGPNGRLTSAAFGDHQARRHRGGGRAGPVRHRHAVGGDEHGAHLRLEDGQCLEPRGGRARPDRRRVGEHAAALPDGDLHRPGELESRLDHLQRLQREDTGDAGSRVRGHVRPGRLDVRGARRHGRRGLPRHPCHLGRRLGRDDRGRHRLRRGQERGRRLVGGGRQGPPARRRRRPRARARQEGPGLRRHPRPGRLDAEVQVDPGRTDGRGAAREAAPRRSRVRDSTPVATRAPT